MDCSRFFLTNIWDTPNDRAELTRRQYSCFKKNWKLLKTTVYWMVSGKIFDKVFRKLDVQTKRRLDLVIRKLEEDPVLGKPLRGS